MNNYRASGLNEGAAICATTHTLANNRDMPVSHLYQRFDPEHTIQSPRHVSKQGYNFPQVFQLSFPYPCNTFIGSLLEVKYDTTKPETSAEQHEYIITSWTGIITEVMSGKVGGSRINTPQFQSSNVSDSDGNVPSLKQVKSSITGIRGRQGGKGGCKGRCLSILVSVRSMPEKRYLMTSTVSRNPALKPIDPEAEPIFGYHSFFMASGHIHHPIAAYPARESSFLVRTEGMHVRQALDKTPAPPIHQLWSSALDSSYQRIVWQNHCSCT